MPAILDEIVAKKRDDLRLLKRDVPIHVLQQQAVMIAPGQFVSYLNRTREPGNAMRYILEIKPASPSAGVLTQELDLPALMDAYNAYGSGISVLTDTPYFKGSFNLLHHVVQRTTLPVLCKDFVIDPYQVFQARVAGASGVLLIVKILTDDELVSLTHEVRQLGMTPIIEIQNEAELARSLVTDPEILLINNRNLTTFDIDLTTTTRLVPQIPESVVCISASGIQGPDELEVIRPVCQNALIGTHLMKTPLEQLPAVLGALSE